MDITHPERKLVHVGKLLRQPDTGFDLGGWVDMVVILLDNYCEYLQPHNYLSTDTSLLPVILTKARESEGVTKYQVYRRVRTLHPVVRELM